MPDWTAGYVADIGYTFGYYSELNPLRMRLALLQMGIAAPEVGTACELGFGQGLSINVHAAATTTQWHGTDFNPAQAAFAQELAAASGARPQLRDDAFADFAQRGDLPDFDFIGLHGIWSWISEANRNVVVDFVRRKMKPGGVLYVSYNTLPGWAAFAPMRHLMVAHAATVSATGQGIVQRINDAIEFAEKLLRTEPAYARANPQLCDRVHQLKGMSRQYLAHEYFNRDWHPMHFNTMVDQLAPAKLDFACSAHFLDLIDGLNLSPEQQLLLGEIPDVVFRESVRDFMLNQPFRRDYWVKGVRRLTAMQRAEALRSQRVVLVTSRPEVSLKLRGAAGEVTLNERIYGPILDALGDHRPHTVAQLEQAVKAQRVTFAQLQQAVLLLTGAGHLTAAQDDTVISQTRSKTQALNERILAKVRSGGELGFLASPVTGGGVPLARFQQLCLAARKEGVERPEAWAAQFLEMLERRGDELRKQNKVVEMPPDTLAKLTEQAGRFATQGLPVLSALQVI